MIFADGGIVCNDVFDKMDLTDTAVDHDAML